MVEVAIDVIRAWGHVNVRATHRSTIELTKDEYLTPRGDCIVGIKANKALSDLDLRLKSIIRRDGSIVIAVFSVGEYFDYVVGLGSSRLTLSSNTKLIIRRSDYVDDATLMIKANKAAADLNRELVDRLKKGEPLLVYIIGVDFGSDRTA
ncbi:MAG: DUF371 domain-containing protein [Vulcanisaeta sp.]|nr:DUF371 domain-containing protein [Vulcanisaeta sp.]